MYTCLTLNVHSMKFLFALIVCGLSFSASAQKGNEIILDSTMIQLSGVVVTDDDLEALSYTTVFDKTVRRGVIADFYGYFSLVTFPGDTLYFSYYGHKTSVYVVPDTLTDQRFVLYLDYQPLLPANVVLLD